MSILSSCSVGSFSSGSSEEDRSEEYIINEDHSSTCSSLELEDIQEAILGVRRTILETEEASEARKELVHKLIRLRIKKEDLENRHYFLQPGELESRGHSLLPAEPSIASARPAYCQECGGGAWPLLQTVYCCKTCGHTIHGGCLPALRRVCVGAFLQKLSGEEGEVEERRKGEVRYDGSLSLAICPELSLAEQEYRCAECGLFMASPSQARVCDYTGLSYCQSCHWDYSSPSPARVLCNWDFTPRPMSQASLQYISLLAKRPVLHLAKIAPGLAAVMEEVGMVAVYRMELLAMKRYLVVCRLAQEERLLTRLKDRQHFVEGAEMYSFRDLQDLKNGVLTAYLTSILAVFRTHIHTCVLCMAKSFVCEVCLDKETLFPFDQLVEVCPHCLAVFHRECFRSVSPCPRCERKKEFREKKQGLAREGRDIED